MTFLYLYAAMCFSLFAFMLWPARKDDDITVGDAFVALLLAFLPPINLALLTAAIMHGFHASGANFSDRVFIHRKRK